MSNLGTEREITKFFAMSSVNLRPDACQLMFEKVQKLVYTDERREFLNKFLKYFKEWQALNQKSAQINKQLQHLAQDNAVLDATIVQRILSTMNLQTSSHRMQAPFSSSSENPSQAITVPPQKKSFGSFKAMKN